MHILVHNTGNEASQSHHRGSHLGSCGTAPCTAALGKTRKARLGLLRRGPGEGGWGRQEVGHVPTRLLSTVFKYFAPITETCWLLPSSENCLVLRFSVLLSSTAMKKYDLFTPMRGEWHGDQRRIWMLWQFWSTSDGYRDRAGAGTMPSGSSSRTGLWRKSSPWSHWGCLPEGLGPTETKDGREHRSHRPVHVGHWRLHGDSGIPCHGSCPPMSFSSPRSACHSATQIKQSAHLFSKRWLAAGPSGMWRKGLLEALYCFLPLHKNLRLPPSKKYH